MRVTIERDTALAGWWKITEQVYASDDGWFLREWTNHHASEAKAFDAVLLMFKRSTDETLRITVYK